MKIAIMANGQLNNKIDFSIYDFVVAVDGGANHCKKINIKPNLIIGDLDSIQVEFEDVSVKQVNDQNKTDLEKALDYIVKKFDKKIKAIDIYGATSLDRFDHTLGNVFIVKKYSGWPIKIITDKQTIEIVNKNKIINNKKNKLASIFPLTKTQGLKSKGFKWQLSDNKISVSNIITEDQAEIKIKKGSIILIINN